MLKLAAFFYLGMALLGMGLNVLRGVPPVPLAFTPKLWPALGAAALMAGATLIFTSFGATRWTWMQRLEALFRQMLGPLRAHETLFLALASGTAEEIFFRGALQPALGRVTGSDVVGMLLASLAFGVIHTGPDRTLRSWTVFALVLGVFLGAVTLACGNVLPAIGCHVAINAVNLQRIARPISRAGT